jgi:dipeptidyl aminopeptidase/acylaminoacyl peptidase
MRPIIFVACLLLMLTQNALAQTDCPAPDVPTTPIRYVSIEAGDLWLWDIHADPTEVHPVRLVDTGDVNDVQLSDDGQVIVFRRQLAESRYDLWAINADGSNERSLIAARQFDTMRTEDPAPDGVGTLQMTWIPNTHTLAFNTRVFYDDGLYIAIADDLWTLNVDTGELINLLPRGEGGEFSYSPDGSQIAVMSLDSLNIVNADGSNRRDDVLESFEASGMGEYYQFPQVRWADDNQTLTVAVNAAPDPYSQPGAVSVWRVDSGTLDTVQTITPTAFYPSAHLSPDAQKLGFWYTDEEGLNMRTMSVVDVASGDTLYSAEGELLDFMSWSPDSMHFIYRDASAQLHLTDLCGDDRPLDEGDTFISASWVDAGRYFLIWEGGEIFLNTVAGDSTRLSTEMITFDFSVLEGENS